MAAQARVVIVGGGIVGELRETAIRADYAASDANDGIRVIDKWFGAEAGDAI